jgi:hypothetical protein
VLRQVEKDVNHVAVFVIQRSNDLEYPRAAFTKVNVPIKLRPQ